VDMSENRPTVVVLAGANGAGKTTAAKTLLADTLKLMTFVNADVIAQGLSGFNPESMAIQAGRVMIERLHDLANSRADFAFETTLAGKSHAQWLQRLSQTGYIIHLVYLWLSSPDLAVARVGDRVRLGGHSIPDTTIRQRYRRSIANFFRLYRPLASSWEVYDNSGTGLPQLVAKGTQHGTANVLNPDVWNEVQKP
jgi:predicted ABC-type ATPase